MPALRCHVQAVCSPTGLSSATCRSLQTRYAASPANPSFAVLTRTNTADVADKAAQSGSWQAAALRLRYTDSKVAADPEPTRSLRTHATDKIAVTAIPRTGLRQTVIGKTMQRWSGKTV